MAGTGGEVRLKREWHEIGLPPAGIKLRMYWSSLMKALRELPKCGPAASVGKIGKRLTAKQSHL